MADFSLKGMGVALITPFKADKSIDFDALERLLEFHLQSGTDYLVALGTTAETPTLSWEERNEIVRFIVSHVQGKLPIIAGMGSNNTKALIEEVNSFNFEGVNSILSVTPFYSKPTQEGLYQHYKALSQASPLPIVLYNVPGRTGVNMKAETTVRIARSCKNVIGIKEAHVDIDQVKEIINGAPDEFSVLSGDDSMTIDLIKEGGMGVISVLGNAFPKEFSAIVKSALKGDINEAQGAYERIVRCCELLFVDGNPAGVKCALHLMGYIKNELRLPLVPATQETENALKQEIRKCTE
ncbi:MAG: 4-hydroxy-tetrahydrodipicolinate synthase [Dysgonamonadaceae bacterium]|jgi:4-hydroxy-tetrahydrodipicolinate synthase|nr:4-hydroxy-tetrahydrodipicolinate synthase [Dysgonamonadaceae bacterium]MDD3355716.1 4-hydroxy-tetrahydrodipicolinate synthase [Dysgonamonadaceae bacterium]MDD3727451.1 4-hydroxy-tetrahydrodipicolinate synthase [Dysgonamonadaceae bacterium]MDD4246115.1 4-hydroxy-tetrahydrodipicolinate synthase [Dysgonamonadaceae bacterium]MDD4605366.1 4-hydroxy-tetrahydrodipicolinate synthase [Dysgonamonadaceae bacterium]